MMGCQVFYDAVASLKQMWTQFANTITGFLNECSSPPCTWWCLCCNKWLCWVVVIILAIIYFFILVAISIFTLILVPVCWGTCFLIAILIALGRGNVPNCFIYSSPSPPSPTAPSPPLM
jgi:hypothetical protein